MLSSHIFEDIEETASDVLILRGGRIAFEVGAETLRSAVLYRSTAPGAVAASPGLVACWTLRETRWMLARKGSEAEGELSQRSNCVEVFPNSILGALYHGSEHLDVD